MMDIKFVDEVSDAEIVAIPGAGKGFNWLPAAEEMAGDLARLRSYLSGKGLMSSANAVDSAIAALDGLLGAQIDADVPDSVFFRLIVLSLHNELVRSMGSMDAPAIEAVSEALRVALTAYRLDTSDPDNEIVLSDRLPAGSLPVRAHALTIDFGEVSE